MRFSSWSTFLLIAILGSAGAVNSNTDSASSTKTKTASEFVSRGDSHLSSGDLAEAVTEYDSAIRLEPENYLYLFKRGAALLSLGRDSAALKDFDRVLEIQPKLESALNQRARINLKFGRLDAALDDAQRLMNNNNNNYYAQTIIDNVNMCSSEWQLAVKAAGVDEEKLKQKKKQQPSMDIEGCILHSSQVLNIAPSSVEMRKLRARCRLANGDAREALVDLSHVESLVPSNPDAFVTAAQIHYYKYHEYDMAMQNLRRCLQYDPDCNECLKIHRKIRKIEKRISRFNRDSRSNKVSEHPIWEQLKAGLVDEGLYKEVENEVIDGLIDIGLLKNPVAGGKISSGSSDLIDDLNDGLCEAYYNMKKYVDGKEYCELSLAHDNAFVPGILLQAEIEMDKENYEAAAQILWNAQQQAGVNDGKIQAKLHEAQVLARRSKEKDYYKVLGVSRTADEKEIKKAYRGLTKQYHPDKYKGGDMSLEEAERKMADINEAYEILSDEEKRRQFDNGQDPNNPGAGGGPGGSFRPFTGSPFGNSGGGSFHQQHFQGSFDFGSFQQQFKKQQFRGQA